MDGRRWVQTPGVSAQSCILYFFLYRRLEFSGSRQVSVFCSKYFSKMSISTFRRFLLKIRGKKTSFCQVIKYGKFFFPLCFCTAEFLHKFLFEPELLK
uniref:Uncharacterized protein n=1 Tax=Anguilla anguilla TaxID=7936 RepID=A0A0E9WY74_ANGAN